MKATYLVLAILLASMCWSVRGQDANSRCSVPTEDISDVLTATRGTFDQADYNERLENDSAAQEIIANEPITDKERQEMENTEKAVSDALAFSWNKHKIDWRVCPTISWWSGWNWWSPRHKCWVRQSVRLTRCRTKRCRYIPYFPYVRFYCRQRYCWQRLYAYCPFNGWPYFRFIWVRVPCCCDCTKVYCHNLMSSLTARDSGEARDSDQTASDNAQNSRS